MSKPGPSPRRPQALLVADPNNEVMAPKLEGYVARTSACACGGSPTGAGAARRRLGTLGRARTPWSPTATMDEWLYLRPDVARLGRDAPVRLTAELTAAGALIRSPGRARSGTPSSVSGPARR